MHHQDFSLVEPRLVKVREISAEEHNAFLAEHPHASFMQLPAWGEVKAEWDSVSLGIFHGEALVGAALVLLRQAPVVRRSLAYIPMGPVVDWERFPAEAVVKALIEDLRRRGAFAVRFGPAVQRAVWSAASVRKAMGAGNLQSLEELEPTSTDSHGERLYTELKRLGARPLGGGLDFEAGQPAYVALTPLAQPDGAPMTLDQVYKRFSSTTRRDVRRAVEAGFVLEEDPEDAIDRFYAISQETAERQDFISRPAGYFELLHRAMNEAKAGSCRIYVASEPDGKDLAAALLLMHGTQAWYLYGGSVSENGGGGAPRFLQHVMMEAALENGCTVLDQGGVTSTLQLKGNPAGGLTRFKTSMGSDIVRTVGEWEIPINKPLTWAFNLYMKRRSAN